MSSAILSPRTPSISLDNSNRPRRNVSSSSRPNVPRGNIRRSTRQSTASPAPTHSSGLSVSSRTRSRASASPDKLEVQLRSMEKERNQQHDEEEGEEEIEDDMVDDVSSVVPSNALRMEDGEEEIEDLGEDEDDDLTRPPTPEPAETELPRETHRIRLVFNPKGMKRKAEEDMEEVIGSVPPSQTGTDIDADTETAIELEADADRSKDDKAAARDLVEREREQAKRMPRKKRKWLKKGEVDPDDHIAVARQKERHKLIDDALGNLDEQYDAVLNGSHESLVWMLEELERRRDLQLTRLAARHEAEVADLKRMNVHGVRQAWVSFKERRKSLVDEMNAEWRWTSCRLKQENILLKVIPNTYSAPRDGRGGGGWILPSGGLLSLGHDKLVPVDNSKSPRYRREISLEPRGFGAETAKRDLAAIGWKRKRSRGESKTEVKPYLAAITTSHASQATPKRTDAAPPSAPAPPRHTPILDSLKHAPLPPSRPSVPNNPPRNSYAAAPASASYAYQPSAHPAQPDRRFDPPSYTPPMPLYHGAAKGDSNYLSWEEYRAYAKHDAWGCPLPHDNYRRDLVLRESWEKQLGKIRRDSVPITPFGARVRTIQTSRATNSVRAPTSTSVSNSQIQQSRSTNGQTVTSVPSHRPGMLISQNDPGVRLWRDTEDRMRWVSDQDMTREDRAREDRIKIEKEQAKLVAGRLSIPPFRGFGGTSSSGGSGLGNLW